LKRADKFANTVILSAVLGIGAVIAYLLYKQIQGVPTPIYYYGLAVGVFLFLLATFKLSRPYRLNVVILLISMFVMLYGMEAILFFYGNPLSYRTPRYIAAQRSGVDYDSRTPLQVVDQLRSKGIDAYPYVAPNYFIAAMPAIEDVPIYALGGIANVTTVMCNESGDYVLYESDRYGFLNPDAVWDEPEAEIVAVGDSFTQGACVPTDKNMVSLIRKAYPRTLNLGSSGSGPLGMLAALKEYGEVHKPPIVLWFYFEGNDLGDMLDERKNPFLTNYLTGDFTQDLMARQDEVDEVRHQYVTALIANLHRHELSGQEELIVQGELVPEPLAQSTDSVADTPLNAVIEIDPIFDEGIDYFGEVLGVAQAEVDSWGGRLILIYLPDYMRYDAEAPVSEEAMYRQEILPVIAELGISMIDMHPIFSAQPNPASLFPFEMQGHYNEEGYALVAAEVLKFLENR